MEIEQVEKHLLNILYSGKSDDLTFYIGATGYVWSSNELPRCTVRTALENLVNTGYLKVAQEANSREDDPALRFKLQSPVEIAVWKKSTHDKFVIPIPIKKTRRG